MLYGYKFTNLIKFLVILIKISFAYLHYFMLEMNIYSESHYLHEIYLKIWILFCVCLNTNQKTI